MRFRNMEILKHSHIMVLETRTIEEVTHPLGVESASRGLCKDWRTVRVLRRKPEILICSTGGELPFVTRKLGITIYDPKLRTAAGSDASEIIASSDRKRRAGLPLGNGRERPSTQEFARPMRVIA